jgi:uncharacterized protein YbcC (UPF0753/DUF2309 family)
MTDQFSPTPAAVEHDGAAKLAAHPGSNVTNEMREQFKHHLEHYCHMLPEQGPMSITFVHNNTLFGLQNLHFEDAIERAESFLGAQGYESNAMSRERYMAGRITDRDLDWALSRRKNLDQTRVVASIDGREVEAGEIFRAHMIRGIDALSQTQMRYAAEVEGATRKLHGDLPEATRAGLMEKGKAELAASIARVGVDWTLSDWLQQHLRLDFPGHALNQVRLGLAQGIQLDEATDVLLRSLEIPADRRAGYLVCVDKKLAAVVGAPSQLEQARRLWISAELDGTANVLRRETNIGGGYAQIASYFEHNIEEYVATALWGAALGLLSLNDPFSSTDAQSLDAHDHQASMVEALADQSRSMERWGGPAIGLSPNERADISCLVGVELERLGTGTAAEAVGAIDLAHLCWTVLHDLGDDQIMRHGFDALEALVSMRAEPVETELALLEKLRASDPRLAMNGQAEQSLRQDIAALGAGSTHADLLQALTGDNVIERVNQYMIRVCTAFFDEGLAAWHLPGRALGFYESWRNLVLSDSSFDIDGVTDWKQTVQHMPTLAVDQVIQQLQQLGIAEEQWAGYCAPLLAELKGWAGMTYWRQTNPAYPQQVSRPIDIMQYLAVRLFCQSLLVNRGFHLHWQINPGVADVKQYFAAHLHEYFVRHELHAGELPDYLAERARRLADDTTATSAHEDDRWAALADQVWVYRDSQKEARRAADEGWRLYKLSQCLGLSAADLGECSEADVRSLFAALEEFPPKKHRAVWLVAFEYHYRTEILNPIRQNVARTKWRTRDHRPKAQVILCIDEREENLHRAISELEPEIETIGAAGFMGVIHDHQGVDSHYTFPLCPAVRTPAHRTFEVPRDHELESTYPVHQRRSRLLEALRDGLWEIEHNVVGSFFMINLLGVLHAIPLIGRLFFPRTWASAAHAARSAFVPAVQTRLTVTRVSEAEANTHHLPLEGKPIGFTLEEQVNMMETFLRGIGLTRNFAPIVFTAAHGSNSANNPHENAHDCGACSGKRGAPNARAQAVMCNNPQVRAGLRERGIDITDDTWFVGAEHNTASSLISVCDAQDIPAHLHERFDYAYKTFVQAAKLAARERCRRFASAPKDASPDVSLKHVLGRSLDLSQVRPEWGHCTNAFAVVGRRSVCESIFLDRRGFNISYDPTEDPDGTILERTLLAVGPVGAGINLEYYFSTVDPKSFGCDTKVPHNVTGLFGVMEGAASDLRTGLPAQMTELHEAMRLQLIVETTTEIAGAIYGRQPALQELLDGEWVLLTLVDPDTGECNTFVPGVGFEKREEPLTPVPEFSDSFEYYKGKYECFLPPAFIKPAVGSWLQ